MRIGEFLLAELRPAGTGRWLRSWQDGQARHLAYAGDYAWVVELFTRLAELTGEAGVARPRPRDSTRHAGALRRRDGIALHHGDRRRARSWSAPWTSSMERCPPPTASPPPPCCASGPCAVTTDSPKPVSRCCGRWRPVAAEHPLACANTVGGMCVGRWRHHRGRDRRRTARSPGRGAARFEPTVVLAWGERTLVTPVGRPRRRLGVRVPALRLPGARRHPRRARTAARCRARERTGPRRPRPVRS